MEPYYIAALENGGLVFYRVKESELSEFKQQWQNNTIYFIVPVGIFHKALCHLI